MSELIVTLAHLRTIPGFSARGGFCRRGAHSFFLQHRLDWSRFIQEGIPAAQLEATGDAMAQALVNWARECVSGR
ncbi:hypothetical protein ABB27_14605 [Stenotrophomonas terrae]|uniref:Uncharacterized protein n=1 Tax=Stenotrophomonas terrae TaxID=405446 RepID=A0A0R0CIU0_9GAMM|nr:hypothetical protein [Stenotrophomonas terrae]KRG65799.1 hypothetical protein ABB27_14605 [Stenotrophomonas terrae]